MSDVKKQEVNGIEILYVPAGKEQDADLQNCLLFERNAAQSIYIRVPYVSKAFPTMYEDSDLFAVAKKVADTQSQDQNRHVATIFVKDGQVISSGANGSSYHMTHGCERVRQHIPSGQHYELCEGCHPKNHSEAKAIQNAIEASKTDQLEGASAYLWGHWWACELCCTEMANAGIKKLVLDRSWIKEYFHIEDQKIQKDSE